MIFLSAKIIVIIFGLFIITCGLLMLFAPEKARHYLRMAGSTNLINYTELALRMLPAAALVLAADASKWPQPFALLGWFMLFSSVVLMLIPRQWHHNYSLKAADILKPIYFRLVSPLAFAFGGVLIYAVL